MTTPQRPYPEAVADIEAAAFDAVQAELDGWAAK